MHSDSAFQNLILQKKSVGKLIFFSVIHNPKNVQFLVITLIFHMKQRDGFTGIRK